jgi:hypothetical protein
MPVAVPIEVERLADPALRKIAERIACGVRLESADEGEWSLSLFDGAGLRGSGVESVRA